MDHPYLKRSALYRVLHAFSLSEPGRMSFDQGLQQNSQEPGYRQAQELKDISEVSEYAHCEHIAEHGSEEEVSALYSLAEAGTPKYIHDLLVNRALSKLEDNDQFKADLISQIFASKSEISHGIIGRLLQEPSPISSFTVAINGESPSAVYQAVQRGFVMREGDLALIEVLVKIFSEYRMSPAAMALFYNALQVLAPLLRKQTVHPYLMQHVIELQLPPGIRGYIFRIFQPVIKEEGALFIDQIRMNNLRVFPLDIICPVSWYVIVRLSKEIRMCSYLDCSNNSDASWYLKLLAATECSILVDSLLDSVTRMQFSDLPDLVVRRLA